MKNAQQELASQLLINGFQSDAQTPRCSLFYVRFFVTMIQRKPTRIELKPQDKEEVRWQWSRGRSPIMENNRF
jgi:hypothetical protein